MALKLSAPEWARVEALFPQATELAGAARAQFLDRECGHEPRVRAELEAMLEAADGNDRLFDAPVGLAASGDGEAMAERVAPGTRFGSWKIRSLIGHGGMGEVYLAERADGAYVMSAAIKLLRRELFSYANAQRFLRERRVLARLSHPNIARVIDAGTTDDGRPYLVMEYVHGSRITDYARARQLGPRDAARLMLAVAEAVAEAHRHGVVHRDLKPANVMVTQEEQVKLLDFGIAKLMEESEAAMPGAVPMTPAYAAPEQILGQPLTPATDVCALGAMLFQLLTQRLPHRREGLPLPVIAAGLRDETVERPSRVVLGSTALLGAGARRRHAQALAGDLDWIVLKALQPDPRRRYPSAAELADDLRRYLEHFPVRARQDSLTYRASRFVRRYPTQVAAASVGIVALALGLAAAVWQARLARAEAQRAERVKEFVLSLFREQDPRQRAAAAAQAPAELVARGVARADAELAANPELQATLLGDLGEIQVALGDSRAGRATLERALAARREQHGAQSLAVAATLRRLAYALGVEGRHEEELARLTEARAILAQRGALDTLEAARLELQLGFAADRGKARGAEAARHFEAAQRIFEAQLGPGHADTLLALDYRAQVLEQARQDAAALALFEELIARVERGYGVDSARLVMPLYGLARVQKRGGPADAARQTFERAVALQRRHYGPVHHHLSDLLRSWADLEQGRGDFARAEALFDEAAAALPATAGPRRGELLKDRGQLRLALGRAEAAERDLREAARLYRQGEGEQSGLTWFVAGEWGRALLATGRAAQAELVQREAVARLAAVMGPDAYQNALVADALAETLAQRGQLAEAIALHRRALALTEARYAPDHRLTAVRQTLLARALVEQGQGLAEAGTLLDRAIATLRGLPAEPGALARALALRGRLHAQERQMAAARPLLEEAVRLFESLPAPDRELGEARRWLAAAGS